MARSKKIPDFMSDAADYTDTETLPQWAIEDLKKSGLSDETIKLTGCFPILSSDQLKDLIGFAIKDGKDILSESEGAYCIPYYDDDFSKQGKAKKFSPNDPPCYYRIKLHKPIVAENGDQTKYLSPTAKKASPYHAYYLPGERAKFRKTKGIIYLVEGEKKAMKLAQELEKLEAQKPNDPPSLVIGFPSVNNWYDWPGWDSLKTSGKKVYIVFDAHDYGIDNESQANSGVQTQATKLWLFLTYQKKAANVKIILWDNTEEFKGIDDYLVAHPEGITTLTEGASDPFDILPILTHADGWQALADIVASLYFTKRQYTSFYEAHNLQSRYGLNTKTWQMNMVAAIKRKANSASKQEKKEQEESEQKPPENKRQAIMSKFGPIIRQVIEKDKTNPKQWFVTPCGVYILKEEYDKDTGMTTTHVESICADPVYIEDRLVDIFDGSTYVRLAWGKKKVLFSEVCLSGIDMKKLTAEGLRIQTPNAKAMAEYFLAAISQINSVATFAANNGWLGLDYTSFVCGNKIIYATETIKITNPEDNAIDTTEHGKRQEWIDLVKKYYDDPSIAIAMSASAAAFLTKPLAVENSIIHIWGQSSQGKSTATQFASSIWGQPLMDHPGSIRRLWRGSDNGIECYFETMKHLPCFLDDSNDQDDDRIVAGVVQEFVDGMGKTRAKVSKSSKTNVASDYAKNWKTLLLSTGERRLTDCSVMEGVAARTIEIQHQKHKEIGEEDFGIMQMTLESNYGFGHELVSYYLQNPARIKQVYLENLKTLSELFKFLSSSRKRCLRALALMLTGKYLLEAVFGFTIEDWIISNKLIETLDTNEPTGTKKLYQALVEHYVSNQASFGKMIESNGKHIHEPPENKEELGIFYENLEISGEFDGQMTKIFKPVVAFHIEKLLLHLKKINSKYSRSQIEQLKKMGVLVTTPGQGNRFMAKLRGETIPSRFYAIILENE